MKLETIKRTVVATNIYATVEFRLEKGTETIVFDNVSQAVRYLVSNPTIDVAIPNVPFCFACCFKDGINEHETFNQFFVAELGKKIVIWVDIKSKNGQYNYRGWLNKNQFKIFDYRGTDYYQDE